ncbi:MAG TPA: class I SAM-dependent methyltransferase [Sphingomicrobium sp.]|nr:class I SAM-dependent methyltransferase [Sphingomicrobium sp.]
MRTKIETPPVFVSRVSCLSCMSNDLTEVTGGSFNDEPLRSFIDADPWGENPLPVLAQHRWSLVECSACSMRFHRNILSPHWNEVRFSKWMSEDAIRQFEATHGTGESPAPAHAQHVLRLRQLGVSRLLDFGCGFGHFIEMCQLFGLDAVGVDRSDARRSGANIAVFPELDQVPGTFDAITMFEVLEHLDDPLGTLRALRKRLNSGGIMIVEVPDASGVHAINDRQSYYTIHPLEHINAFTPDSLVKMMARVGFQPIFKAPAFVTTSFRRLLKDVGKAALKQRTTQRYFRCV